MYTVHPLKVGQFEEPEPRIFYLGDCSRTVALGNFFFLVQGPGTNLLVDSGVTKAEGDRFNPAVHQAPEDDPLQRLAQHGVSPESIEIVIATHLHWDHISPTVLRLPRAMVYLNHRELDMVLSPPHPWFARFVYTEVVQQLLGQGRIVEVRDGEEIVPGVSILHTPGHTLGGISVVVATRSGPAVITGDVCFTYRNLEEDIPGGVNHDLVACFASLQRIRETAGIVLPGHDLRMLELYPEGVS